MNFTIKIGNGIRNIYWPIVVLIVIQRYVSAEAYFLINLVWLIYVIASSRMIVVNPFWGFGILALFVIWGVLLGLQSIEMNSLRDYGRDIYYYVNPLIFLLNGAYFAKLNVDFSKYSNSLILGNFIHVLIFLYQLLTGGEYGGITGYLMVPMAILLVNKFDKERSFTPITRTIMTILYLLPFAIVFSRNSIIVSLCICLFCAIDRNVIRKIWKFAIQATVIVVVAITIFNSVLPEDKREVYTKKIENSFNEISSNQDWDDPGVVTGNWRGYELHCAIEEFKNGNVLQQILGYGFSKKIDVGVYSYILLDLTDEDGSRSSSIAVTHNGYANILVKLGILGVICMIIFFLNLIVKSIKFVKKNGGIEGRMLAGCVFGLMLMTYILNGLYKDTCYYSLVTTIGFLGYRLKYYDKVSQKENKELL